MSSQTTRQIPATERNQLAALDAYDILDTPTEPVFDAIAELATVICNVPMAAIGLLAEDRQWLKASCGLGELREISTDVSFCHRAMEGVKDLLEIQDVRANPRYTAHPMVTGAPRLRFYAGMPLMTPEGHRIGSLCVIDQKPRTLTKLQRTSLKQLAGVVMRLLEAHKAEQHLIRMGCLLERSDDGICVMDAKTLRFEYANENAQTYLGHSLTELRALTPKELQPAAEFAAFQAAIKPLYFNKKATVDIETIGLRKDGTSFPAELRLQLWQDNTRTKLYAAFKDITLRKALATRERHLQAVLEAVPECIKLISQDGALLDMTSTGLAMLEAGSLAEVQKKRLIDYAKPEYRPAFLELHSKVFQGLSGTLEFQVVGLKGGQRWLETYAVPLRDETGNVLSLLGATRDISERKQAEMEHALLASIVEHSDDAIVSTTTDGIFTSWNRGAERLFGYTEAEAIGQPVLFLIPEANHYKEQLIQIHIQDGKALDHYESKLYHKSGKLIDVSLTVSPVIDKDGHVIAISKIVRDISERKAAEEALFQEKELAQITLKSIGDAVITTDPEGNVTYLNPIAEVMTGWSNEQAIGCPLSQVFHILESNTRQPAPNPLDVAMRENRRVGLAINSVLVARHGKEAAVEDSASPIHDRDGNIIGGVLIFRDVSETREMAIHMTHLAQHDFLTNLPNRVLLHDRLAQALAMARRNDKKVALLFIDLDRFKQVNDSLGHEAGDKLLKEIASRLKASVRESDTVCRQGGDEFVAVLPDIDNINDVTHIAEKLRNVCAQAHTIDGHEVHISASIGISLFPHDGSDIDTLSRNADAAMYHAKASARNNFQFYTLDMNARAHEALILENDLRRALRQNEFVLYYQPILNLTTQCIIGCEALLRWQAPNRGLVLPDNFLPLIEENGLIVPVSQWALREACQQGQSWKLQGLKPVPVAVNLSAAQFKRKDFLASVIDTLAETGLDPHYLDLELTESIVMNDTEATISVLQSLKEMGVQISIDDFGTGYSSLSHLRRFPIDTLKIDQSFVRDLTTDVDDAAITSAIICMAKSLRQRVVAEGVETMEQLDFLRGQGCDSVQGFYYYPPLPAEEFAKLLV